MRFLLGVAAAAALPTFALAQSDELLKAAKTISAEDIARHASVIGHDSMQGRATPSVGLDKTAAYVAAQFAQAGLQPAGDSAGWFHRYWILPQLDFAASRISLGAGGKTAIANFTTAARLLGGRGPEHATPTSVVLIAGTPDSNALAQAKLENKTVLYVPLKSSQWSVDAASAKATLAQLREKAGGLVVLSEQDSSSFASRQRRAHENPGISVSRQWSVAVQPDAVTGLRDVLAAANIDLPRLQTDTTPVVRELPSFQVSVDLKRDRPATDSTRAPNVVGVLEGASPELKGQYVAIIAHMDAGGRPRSGGADDNAAGVASLIALAKAYTQPGMRPARSLVFIATSGGTEAHWGSNALAAPIEATSTVRNMIAASFRSVFDSMSSRLPAGALQSAVQDVVQQLTPGVMAGMANGNRAFVLRGTGDSGANAAGKAAPSLAGLQPAVVLNLDHVARTAGDTVVVDGVGDAQFASMPSWVAGAHADELRLNVLDGSTAAAATSDQYPFVQRGVPALYFHSALDNGTASADPSAADLDWTARVVRLVFYVGRDIANADRRPAWTREGRRAYLEASGQ